MIRRSHAIQSYSLFGESAHLPDVLHCETIEARSSLHDWELEPHRHARLHQVLVLASGGGRAHVEGTSIELAPRSVLNIPAGTVHGFSFSPGSGGFVMTLPDELVAEGLTGADAAKRVLAGFGIAQLDRRLSALATVIWTEFSGRQPARALVLRGLGATLLGLVARGLAAASPSVDGDAATPRLYARFEALLESHFAEQWHVARYADALGVTPTHLSRVTHEVSGLPASGVIDQRLMREARRQLTYTSMSISTIAYTLGYSDPAHFSRAFSRSVGHSPRAFRERQK